MTLDLKCFDIRDFLCQQYRYTKIIADQLRCICFLINDRMKFKKMGFKSIQVHGKAVCLYIGLKYLDE